MGFNVGSSWENMASQFASQFQRQNASSTSGTQNVDQTGTQTGSTTGTQTGTTTGNQTGTTSSTSTPTTTANWDNLQNIISGNYGKTGLTGGQQGVVDNLKNWQTSGQNAGAVLTGMAPEIRTTAGQTARDVSGRTGAEFAGAYKNPFENDVVSASLGDLENSFMKSQNHLRAQYGGQGWSPTAGSSSGTQIAAAQGADDYLRNVASTSAGLRSQGFNTAQGLGAGDAGRFMAADISNQAIDNTGIDRKLGGLRDIAGNAVNAERLGMAANQQIFDMYGGGGQNLLQFLGLQTPAFGQSTTGTQAGTSAANTSGTTAGTSAGTTANTTLATNASNTTGTESGSTSGTSNNQGSGRESSFGK